MPIYFFIVLIVIAIVIILITYLSLIISKRRRKIVQETSELIKELIELNSQYKFNCKIRQQYVFMEFLQSKSKFDRYKLINLFDENILKSKELIYVAEAISKNRCLYSDYQKRVECLKSSATQERIKELHIPYNTYITIEKELFSEQQLHPILDCDIVCIASYSSPQGRNHYEKTAKYKIDEVPQRYKELQQHIAMQNSEEARRRRVRSQMTDKLRYTILKRDGFKCKLCGRTRDDGVKLHVDHIIPVSKGGGNNPDNLRTLCETCNWGKGDEIE